MAAGRHSGLREVRDPKRPVTSQRLSSVSVLTYALGTAAETWVRGDRLQTNNTATPRPWLRKADTKCSIDQPGTRAGFLGGKRP